MREEHADDEIRAKREEITNREIINMRKAADHIIELLSSKNIPPEYLDFIRQQINVGDTMHEVKAMKDKTEKLLKELNLVVSESRKN